MSAGAAFGAGLLAAALVLAGVLALLLPRLRPALDELCDGAERGRFWTLFGGFALAAGVALATLCAFLLTAGAPPLASAVAMARGALAGALLGQVPIGVAVLGFTRARAR